MTATHSLLAHRLIHAVLKTTPASRLSSLPQVKGLLEALIPYSERHFERLDRLAQGAHFVGYTLAASMVLLPPETHGAEATDAAPPLPLAPAGAIEGGGATAAVSVAEPAEEDAMEAESAHGAENELEVAVEVTAGTEAEVADGAASLSLDAPAAAPRAQPRPAKEAGKKRRRRGAGS